MGRYRPYTITVKKLDKIKKHIITAYAVTVLLELIKHQYISIRSCNGYKKDRNSIHHFFCSFSFYHDDIGAPMHYYHNFTIIMGVGIWAMPALRMERVE